jgi:glycerate kinase
MLPPGRHHPFNLDTRGLATVLQAVAKRQTRTCLIGIGGSATNDGGFGLAVGLGWEFLDRAHRVIRRWIDLANLATIVPPARPNPLSSMRLAVATDVDNRLLGRYGATRVYGPQKGIRPGDVAQAERALGRLSAVVRRTVRTHFADQPGAGAAGGLGFGLAAFAGAKLQSGIQLYARHANLDAHLDWAELVITGEGQMDASTLMGKGVGEIARRAGSRHLPCIGIAGSTRNVRELEDLFVSVQALTPDRMTLQDAMRHPARHLSQLSFDLASAPPLAVK